MKITIEAEVIDRKGDTVLLRLNNEMGSPEVRFPIDLVEIQPDVICSCHPK